MNSKQWYKDTFDLMEMSDESMRKVKGIMEMKEKKRIRTGFRAAVVAGALVFMFVVGNIAVYAATGSTLVEKGIEKVSVIIDKKSINVREMKKYKDEDGNSHYEITFDSKDGKTGGVAVYNDKSMEEGQMSAVNELGAEDDGTVSANITLFSRELKQKGKKIYLVVADEKEIDITKDFKDGKAKGVFRMNGEDYKYTVSGTVEKYEIEITK